MFATRRVGGLRFVRIGQLSFSYCITRRHRALASYLPSAELLQRAVMSILVGFPS